MAGLLEGSLIVCVEAAHIDMDADIMLADLHWISKKGQEIIQRSWNCWMNLKSSTYHHKWTTAQDLIIGQPAPYMWNKNKYKYIVFGINWIIMQI